MPELDRVLDGVLTTEEVGFEGFGLEAVAVEDVPEVVGAGVGEVTGGVRGEEGVADAVGVDIVGADEEGADAEGVDVEVCAGRRATEKQESTSAAKAEKRRERKEIGSMKIQGREKQRVEPMKYNRRFRSLDCFHARPNGT